MKLKLWCSLLVLMVATIVLPMAVATTFVPLSVEQKVVDSDAIVFGTVLRSYGKKDRGRVVTEVVLDVDRSLGLQFGHDDLRSNFKLQYLGGVWAGVVHQIEGAPEFAVGEKVMVMLRHSRGVFWIHNLAPAKFSQVEREGEDFLVSTVFSEKKGVGVISLHDFNKILAHTNLTKILIDFPDSDKAVQAPESKGSQREKSSFRQERKLQSIASGNAQDVAAKFPLMSLVLALMGMALMAMAYRKYRK